MSLFPVSLDVGANLTTDIYFSVYAIHGLGSDPASTWNNSKNGTNVCWLKDLLPKVPGLTNIKVTMVNHQSHWSEDAANMQFEDHARTLLDEIERVRHDEGAECRPIVFIAHSFGGLLLKQVLFHGFLIDPAPRTFITNSRTVTGRRKEPVQ